MRKEYETPSVQLNRFAPTEAFALVSSPDNEMEFADLEEEEEL